MGIAGREEGHALCKVENADFGHDARRQVYVVDVVAGLLGDEDVGLGDFEGFGEGGFGGFRVGFRQLRVGIEVVEDKTSLGAGKLKDVLEWKGRRHGEVIG